MINRVRSKQSKARLAEFLLDIVPACDLLKQTRNNRVFVKKTILDILILLLEELREQHPSSKVALSIDNQLSKAYTQRDPTTQPKNP